MVRSHDPPAIVAHSLDSVGSHQEPVDSDLESPVVTGSAVTRLLDLAAVARCVVARTIVSWQLVPSRQEEAHTRVSTEEAPDPENARYVGLARVD